VAAASTATAGGRPSFAAGPAFGFVPSRNVNHQKGRGHLLLLAWHFGPVHACDDGRPGLLGLELEQLDVHRRQDLRARQGLFGRRGTPYAHTNFEYTDGSGNVNTTNISKGSDVIDSSATPSGAPSTSAVLQEVAKVTNNHPVANAYYPPVYSDQPRW